MQKTLNPRIDGYARVSIKNNPIEERCPCFDHGEPPVHGNEPGCAFLARQSKSKGNLRHFEKTVNQRSHSLSQCHLKGFRKLYSHERASLGPRY